MMSLSRAPSAIFKFSAERIERFRGCYPDGILGGTGTDSAVTVEQIIRRGSYELYSYDGWDADYSIGFTQRRCRLKCKFCIVPQKEGKNVSVNTIESIWRGEPHPKKLHLLDNDFFGQPEAAWRARIEEIRAGGFRVCLSQGINIRLVTPEAAAALAKIEYRDTKFSKRRLYTAWDNLGDEAAFFRGVDRLEAAGIPPQHLMAYMLVGFDPKETWPRIWHRFNRMVERGTLLPGSLLTKTCYFLKMASQVLREVYSTSCYFGGACPCNTVRVAALARTAPFALRN